MSSPALATNPSDAGCANCCMVTHTCSQGTPSTSWAVRYCAYVMDRCSDRMRHTKATVFSHMDGAVGRAPLPPPSTGVRTIRPVSGRCFTKYSAPSSPDNVLQCPQAAGRVLPGLDMGKGLLPLVAQQGRLPCQLRLESHH